MENVSSFALLRHLYYYAYLGENVTKNSILNILYIYIHFFNKFLYKLDVESNKIREKLIGQRDIFPRAEEKKGMENSAA